MRLLVLLVILCIASIAYAQPKGAPKPIPPVISKAPDTNEAKQGTTGKQEITVNLPPSINLNISGNANIKTENKQNAANAEPREFIDPANIIAILLVLATWGLVCATWKIVTNARESAKRQLRAYVGVHDVFFPWEEKTANRMDRKTIIRGEKAWLRVRNFGQTPAHHLSVYIGFTHEKYGTKFPFIYKKVDRGPHILQPGIWVGVPTGIDYEPYRDAEKPLTIYGCFVYQDIYERWWLSRFCYDYPFDSQNRFVPSGDHNKAPMATSNSPICGHFKFPQWQRQERVDCDSISSVGARRTGGGWRFEWIGASGAGLSTAGPAAPHRHGWASRWITRVHRQAVGVGGLGCSTSCR